MTAPTWSNERRKLSALIPWPRNPRQIKGESVRRLQESFEEFGQPEVIAISPSNEVYNGHQRLKSWFAKFGDIEVDVRVSSRPLTEKERERLTVLLHRGAVGEWDFETLASEFEVSELLEWGFTEMELGLDAPAGNADAEPQIDRAAELNEKWRVKTGDMFAVGSHRLICGDCTDASVVERVLQGEKPALMVTDPPYGVNYDPNWRNEAAEAGFLSFAPRRTGIVTNDDRIDWGDAYALFPGDIAYTWSPGGDHVILTGLALQKAGFQIRNQIIWVKPHFPISRGHYTYQHEPCWYGVRKGRQAHWIGDLNASTTWKIALDQNVDGGHSTQKPLECMATPIRNHEGDVYDPFLGSGTTMVACNNLGRRCRGIEIAPNYCAVALQRMEDAFPGILIERIEE